MVAVNPLSSTPPPPPVALGPLALKLRAGPEFLALMDGDRTWTVSAFLLGSEPRVYELVSLRWPNGRWGRRDPGGRVLHLRGPPG